jgi:hypothetical protein
MADNVLEQLKCGCKLQNYIIIIITILLTYLLIVFFRNIINGKIKVMPLD